MVLGVQEQRNGGLVWAAVAVIGGSRRLNAEAGGSGPHWHLRTYADPPSADKGPVQGKAPMRLHPGPSCIIWSQLHHLLEPDPNWGVC